jgi:hypothetical protein
LWGKIVEIRVQENRVVSSGNRWLRVGLEDEVVQRYLSVRETHRYERPRIIANSTSPEPLAVFKILGDTESEVYDLTYESDLISLMCELGGLAAVLVFVGRALTSCITRRLYISSLIRKTMQIKRQDRL